MFENFKNTLLIPNSKKHPVPLVESQAMSTVKLPVPQYQPRLPKALIERGLVSDAQLENIIYAGEAHSKFLEGNYLVDENLFDVKLTTEEDPLRVKFRKGIFIADGTGTGKTRQLLGIIIDNWLKGIRKHLWITVNDKLLPDLQKEWEFLGGNKESIIPLSKFKQGNEIALDEGILFCTYGQIRTAAKNNKISRIQQITNWANNQSNFVGTLIFDESHNLCNAIAQKGTRGTVEGSAQAIAGVQLQNLLPSAKVVYSSATAFSKLSNLAYACRLGLWGTSSSPFKSYYSFMNTMAQGGISTLELIANNAKALGVYSSRNLSFEGVNYEQLIHELTLEQVDIYNNYASIFQEIGLNIHKAMSACNITDFTTGKTHNSTAKKNVIGQFESLKQRFFEMLLISCKLPTVIASIEKDLASGHACIIQLINTYESLLKKQLEQIPQTEWNNLHVDITPRESIINYLENCFPTNLYQTQQIDEKITAIPVLDETGLNVKSTEAVAIKNKLKEKLIYLPPINAPIDSIIMHFGAERVAEITGRSLRLIKTKEGNIKVEKRSSSANKKDEEDFMGYRKKILIFSQAGGTGRSYHASLKCRNQRLRVHYLLQPGWNVFTAIQGFGRSHRSDQKQPPLFKITSTNVKSEKRFTGTIAKRLATLGALTKGQSTAAGNNMIDENNNLDNFYGNRALRTLLYLIYKNSLKIKLEEFQVKTGLSLVDNNKVFTSNLPTINQFLNRLLALQIDDQNYLYERLNNLLQQEITEAIEAGRYDTGVENLTADSSILKSSIVLWQDPDSGNQTILNEILIKKRRQYNNLPSKTEKPQLVHNPLTNEVAFWIDTYARTHPKTGEVISQVYLTSPIKNWCQDKNSFLDNPAWKEISDSKAREIWQKIIDSQPTYTESTVYLVSGLLIPLWNKFYTDKLKLKRVKTDCGTTILGMVIDNLSVKMTLDNFGLNSSQIQLTNRDKFRSLQNGSAIEVGKYTLEKVKVQYRHLIEITGWQQDEVPYLKTLGFFVEEIRFRARIFLKPECDVLNLIRKLS